MNNKTKKDIEIAKNVQLPGSNFPKTWGPSAISASFSSNKQSLMQFVYMDNMVVPIPELRDFETFQEREARELAEA